MIEERLSRLNAKSQSFTDTGGGFGGATVADLCAAMAGCSPIGELIIRRKYVDQDDTTAGYYLLLDKAVSRLGKANKKQDRIKELLDIALDDYCNQFKCPSCKGRQQITLPTGQVHKCRSSRCYNGYVRRKDIDRAKALKVKAIDYSRKYKPSFVIIERLLTEILPEAESSALNTIKRQSRWY